MRPAILQLLALSLSTLLIVGCAYFARDASPHSSAEATIATIATIEPTFVPSDLAPTIARPSNPNASPSVRSTEKPSPTAVVRPSTASASPLPSPPPAPDLEASNAFWNRWYDDCYFGPISDIPSSLQELIDKSDAVVLGTIADVNIRRWHRTWDISIATVMRSEERRVGKE